MVAGRRRGAFCKGVVSTAAAGAGLVVAFGVAESPQGDGWHAYPAGGYFSMKKSNQKSLGEDPETPYASEPSRPETLRIPGAGLDDAYKVLF